MGCMIGLALCQMASRCEERLALQSHQPECMAGSDTGWPGAYDRPPHLEVVPVLPEAGVVARVGQAAGVHVDGARPVHLADLHRECSWCLPG